MLEGGGYDHGITGIPIELLYKSILSIVSSGHQTFSLPMRGA